MSARANPPATEGTQRLPRAENSALGGAGPPGSEGKGLGLPIGKGGVRAGGDGAHLAVSHAAPLSEEELTA